MGLPGGTILVRTGTVLVQVPATTLVPTCTSGRYQPVEIYQWYITSQLVIYKPASNTSNLPVVVITIGLVAKKLFATMHRPGTRVLIKYSTWYKYRAMQGKNTYVLAQSYMYCTVRVSDDTNFTYDC